MKYLDMFDEFIYDKVATFERLYVYLLMGSYSKHFDSEKMKPNAFKHIWSLSSLICSSFAIILLLLPKFSTKSIFLHILFIDLPLLLGIFHKIYQKKIFKKYNIIRMSEIYDDLYGGLEQKINTLFFISVGILITSWLLLLILSLG